MFQLAEKMAKVSTVTIFALMLTVSSLYLMQRMILSDEVPEAGSGSIPIADIIMPDLEFTAIKTTPKPERVEKVEIDIEPPPPIEITRPRIGGGIEVMYTPKPPGTNDLVTIEHTEALALSQVAPTYPSRALQRGIEGYVLLEFDIDEAGRVINPRILDAEPEGIFERAALNAIERWRFQPKVANGEAVVKRNEKRLLNFTIED